MIADATLALMPADEKKIMLASRVTPALLADLKQVAKDEQRTLSNVVQLALREWVEARKASRPKPKR